jgi:hypothetical protein
MWKTLENPTLRRHPNSFPRFPHGFSMVQLPSNSMAMAGWSSACGKSSREIRGWFWWMKILLL